MGRFVTGWADRLAQPRPAPARARARGSKWAGARAGISHEVCCDQGHPPAGMAPSGVFALWHPVYGPSKRQWRDRFTHAENNRFTPIDVHACSAFIRRKTIQVVVYHVGNIKGDDDDEGAMKSAAANVFSMTPARSVASLRTGPGSWD